MALSLALSTWGLAACGPPAQIRYEHRLERTAEQSRHAVHSERLAQLMRGLERLYVERLPKALDLQEQQSERANEVALVARALAESAASIEDSAGNLDRDQRQEFRQLADRLRQQSEELSERAHQLSPQEMREHAEALERICNRCHEQFRISREPEEG